MLEIELKPEYWDEKKEQFVRTEGQLLHFEHSLYTISKWEAKWKKPFLNSKKTDEELIDYIRCMCQEPLTDDLMSILAIDNIDQINDYILDSMSASKITNKDTKGGRRTVTSELIYYWMTALNIPWECQHWHLNRLLKLIEVCNAENNPKKMSKDEIRRQNRELNDARRKALKTKG